MKVSLPAAVFFIIPTVFLLRSSNACAQSNDLASLHLNGRVKKIMETNQQANAGAISKGPVGFMRSYEFNEQGKMTLEYFGIYDRPGNTIIFHYDDNGFLTGSETSNPRSGISSRVSIKNDGQGKKLELIACDRNNNVTGSVLKYKYDEKGNMTETWTGRVPVPLQLSTAYKYDGKGNKISQTNYRVDGSSYITTTWTYDEKGNIVVKTAYKTDGKLFYWITYKYDEQGNMIELNDFIANGTLSRKVLFEYEFDKSGNWIKKKERDGKEERSKTPFIQERTIEYY